MEPDGMWPFQIGFFRLGICPQGRVKCTHSIPVMCPEVFWWLGVQRGMGSLEAACTHLAGEADGHTGPARAPARPHLRGCQQPRGATTGARPKGQSARAERLCSPEESLDPVSGLRPALLPGGCAQVPAVGTAGQAAGSVLSRATRRGATTRAGFPSTH
ncbi:uncharacterized protein AAEQ78_019284 [Lycaon pictus]